MSDTFPEGTQYCGDISGAIFLKSSDNYDNMDIDCDGANNHAGACANDPTGQGMTAFQDTVRSYGIDDLDANLHPYVVFGNDGDSPSFTPEQQGMHPLSVMAVVCNGQLVSISYKHRETMVHRLTFCSITVFGETPTVVH